MDTLDAAAHLVSVLTSRPAALEYLGLEVLTVLEEVGGILLSLVAEHGNGHGAGMHSAASLSWWHSLDAMAARFSLG